MGEAKSRLSFSRRIQRQQPFCVYCGGNFPSADIDHVPPICLFDARQRPKEPVVSVCKTCHEGTRQMDQIVSFISRFYPDPKTELQRLEAREAIRAVFKNYPALPLELGNGEDYGDVGFALRGNGPILSSVMTRFAARIGFALYYITLKRIIPINGAVFVRWYSNADAFDGKLPNELISFLGPERTLEQGQFNVRDQFTYSYVEDVPRIAFWCTFRGAFAALAIATTELSTLPDAVHTTDRLFLPGFLKGYRVPSG